MKILTIIGARPQFIKAAVISRVIQNDMSDVTEVLVHTGQHYDRNMSEVFFDQLGIPEPNYNLGVGGGTHGQNTGRMLERLEALMQAERPECVLVYGDTDSTLAGALAASKLHIPVAHVEAGLRSFNRRMPEEINRVLTDHVSEILFTPTEIAGTNLRHEGIDSAKVHQVGDVMYDAALYYKSKAQPPAWFSGLGLSAGEFALCTIHRAENTGDPIRLASIAKGLGDSGVEVVLPLHPRTKGTLERLGITLPSNIHVVEPVGYLEMVWLESSCRLIATDSGGVQKEAYFHGKPCITLRDETEWLELVEVGANHLVGTDSEKIAALLKGNLKEPGDQPLYGSGDSGQRILEILKPGRVGG